MAAPVPARPPLNACAGLRERDLLSIRDMTRDELLALLALALPLFLSCRAAVRAKTSATAANLQTDSPRKGELQDLAARVPGDGTGASTAATGVSDRHWRVPGFRHIHAREGARLDASDADAAVIRQQLAQNLGTIAWHRIDAA
jgi:hypothetical protein